MTVFEKFESYFDEHSHVEWAKFADPMVSGGVSLMKSINALGYEAYIVGGAVRDIAMGDFNVHDIATNMPIEVIKDTFKTYEYGGGEKHGTVIVHIYGYDYELTQFRTETGYSDRRRPDHVEFVQSFEEDTKRRDFTINAMGIDADGKFIDYHGGLEDIRNGILRTVGEATERFDEDALRIMRAIRFASRFGYEIDPVTLEAMKKLAYTVPTTSIERIRDELMKTSSYGHDVFVHALTLMHKTGVWDFIIPEIQLTDVKIERVGYLKSSGLEVVFCVLMNDMEVSEAAELGKRLTFTSKEIKTISYVLESLLPYSTLGAIDRQKALAIVSNADFAILRSVYCALFLSDIQKSEQIIEKISTFSYVRDRIKVVNQIIMDSGFSGARFGFAVRYVTSWLFDDFDDGVIHSDDDIKLFVEGLDK